MSVNKGFMLIKNAKLLLSIIQQKLPALTVSAQKNKDLASTLECYQNATLVLLKIVNNRPINEYEKKQLENCFDCQNFMKIYGEKIEIEVSEKKLEEKSEETLEYRPHR